MNIFWKLIIATSIYFIVSIPSIAEMQAKTVSMKPDGTIIIESAEVPLPSSFSPEAVAVFRDFVASGGSPVLSGDIYEIRKTYDKKWAGPVFQKWQEMFVAQVEPMVIGGVKVDIVTPAARQEGMTKNRVLLNLHGGGFHVGGGIGGLIESVPMAGYGGFKVISVDYRMAPEARFPAATEDVVAVYTELLKEYNPEDIGIYGGSAGGMLTAQVVAYLIQHEMPLPGAISLMCAGAAQVPPSLPIWNLTFTGVEINGAKFPSSLGKASYFSEKDKNDPLAFPGNHPDILRSFPPTLLVSSTRDVLLSSVLYTHKAMLEAGTDASLFVSDGFGHCFFAQQPGLPETESVWQITAKFFDSKLGDASYH